MTDLAPIGTDLGGAVVLFVILALTLLVLSPLGATSEDQQGAGRAQQHLHPHRRVHRLRTVPIHRPRRTTHRMRKEQQVTTPIESPPPIRTERDTWVAAQHVPGLGIVVEEMGGPRGRRIILTREAARLLADQISLALLTSNRSDR